MGAVCFLQPLKFHRFWLIRLLKIENISKRRKRRHYSHISHKNDKVTFLCPLCKKERKVIKEVYYVHKKCVYCVADIYAHLVFLALTWSFSGQLIGWVTHPCPLRQFNRFSWAKSSNSFKMKIEKPHIFNSKIQNSVFEVAQFFMISSQKIRCA